MMANSHFRFLGWFVTTLLFFLLCIGVFNWVVDPYGIFDATRIKGLSAIKPAAGSHVRMSKPYQVREFSPRTIIAGNSRPEMGLNPDSECWPEKNRPVYNLGLPGAGVYMQYRTIQHALHESEISLVLWGLDFSDFIGLKHNNRPDYHWPLRHRDFEDRLIVNEDGSINGMYLGFRLEEFATVAFSLDTTVDSIGTLFQQHSDNVSTRLRNGFNPASDYLKIIANEGQRVLFLQKNSEINKRLRRDGLTLYPYAENVSEEFDSVIHFLKMANEKHIIVKLFINPYHADYLESIYRHDLWDEFETWKRRLTQISAKYGVELWDFSNLNQFNTEILSSNRSGEARLKWFWEPAHYKKEIGDFMLQQLFPSECSANWKNQFGVLLSAQNISSYLSEERIKIDTWVSHTALSKRD